MNPLYSKQRCDLQTKLMNSNIVQTDNTEREKDEPAGTQLIAIESEADEHRLQAADGLLMLRELSNIDIVDPDLANENEILMPINASATANLEPTSTTLVEDKEDSDNTIIYETWTRIHWTWPVRNPRRPWSVCRRRAYKMRQETNPNLQRKAPW